MATRKKIDSPEIERIIRDETDKWFKGNGSEAGLRQFVRERLDHSRNEMVFAAIGMEYRWGEWQVKDVGGRTSPLLEEMKVRLRGVAKEVLEEALDVKVIKLPAKVRDGIRAKCIEKLTRDVQEIAFEKIKAKAEDLVDEIFRSIPGLLPGDDNPPKLEEDDD